ncbi:MAG: hypothetical protein WKF73_17610 [Nocardioidaceae bacterium]
MPHRIRGVDARLSRYSYLVSLLANAPVGYQIEKRFSDDTVRGVVATRCADRHVRADVRPQVGDGGAGVSRGVMASGGSAVQLAEECGRRDSPVGVLAQVCELLAGDVAVESHADPAATSDVWRPEVPVRLSCNQRCLHTVGSGAPQVRKLVVVMPLEPQRTQKPSCLARRTRERRG